MTEGDGAIEGGLVTMVAKEVGRKTGRGSEAEHNALQSGLVSIKEFPFLNLREVSGIGGGEISLKVGSIPLTAQRLVHITVGTRAKADVRNLPPVR